MQVSWSRRAALAAIFTTGLVVGGGAVARPPGGACGGPAGAGLEHLERRIGRAALPAETQAAVYAQIDEARAERRPLEASLDAARQRMRELLEQEPASVEAVMAQADTIGALETQLQKLGLRTMVAIRALVTPEQWESLRPGGPGGSGGPGAPRGPEAAGRDGAPGADRDGLRS